MYTSVCRSRRKIAGLKACARRVGRPRYAERVLIGKEKCLFPSVCGPRTSVRCTACTLWQGNRKAQNYLADPSSALRTHRFFAGCRRSRSEVRFRGAPSSTAKLVCRTSPISLPRPASDFRSPAMRLRPAQPACGTGLCLFCRGAG